MQWPTQYQEFIYTRTYSRWLEQVSRREVLEESVGRYSQFFLPRVPEHLRNEFIEAVAAIERLEVMPSMRALWAAGPALEQDNIAGYNCSYLTINTPKAFAEVLYILMCGTGVGFSVERKYIEQLPEIPTSLADRNTVAKCIVVEDSKFGWANTFLKVLESLYKGEAPYLDTHLVRPAGSRLKTMGGRASGPQPLIDLIEFTKQTFINAAGRKLKPIEVYDIIGKVADCVVVGGVRRSATIVLCDLDDEEMRTAKQGSDWFTVAPQRARANISVAYNEKPTWEQFLVEWNGLVTSGSGERGIFNRQGAIRRSADLGRNVGVDVGTNPCGEVELRPNEFCNLSEVVVRPHDTQETLRQKVRWATILGILQATLDEFSFLSWDWTKNVREERLLGVSLTGIMDNPILQHTSEDAAWLLRELHDEALYTAERWSDALGINMPAAITCVKPSGTVSQMVDSASGIHVRYAHYYLRRVRVDVKDPLAQFLMDYGVPWSPEVGQAAENMNTVVFTFPVKSPEGSVVRTDRTALQQLEHWLMVKENWTEHNPSVTIYVQPDEWDAVRDWVWNHWDSVGGLTFFPADNTVYELAPYQEITQEEYEVAVAAMPTLDFSRLSLYEIEDSTSGAKEIACAGGACEL